MTDISDGEWHPSEVLRIFANFAARQDRPKATVDAFAALYSMGAENESIDDLYERAIARGLPQDVVDMCLRKGQQIAADRQMTRKSDLKVINGELSRHNAIYQSPKGLSEQPVEPPPELEEWDAGNDPGPIAPRQWLMGNQFCRKFLSSLIASGGTGKSALRLLQFISLALGRSLTGQHVFRRCRVLLISLEDDRDELERRIAAVLKYYNIDRAELKGWFFCATPKLVKLAELKNKVRSLGALEIMVRSAIRRRNPDIIGLDPFIKTHGLEENDSADMDFVCDLLARMAVEYNIAVDSPHHTRKGLTSPGDADMGRGSSGIKDAGRLVYTLTPMSEDEAKLFDITAEDRLLYVRLDSAKVNIVRRGGKATWFKLVGVPIDNGTEEYPSGDEVQTVTPWSPPETWANLSSISLNAALTEIDEGLPSGQRYSSASAAKPDRAAWAVIQKHCTGKSEGQCREMVRTWITTGLLVSEDYEDPIERKKRKGLRVDSSKRPS